MAKTVAQRVTDALGDQMAEQCIGTIRRKFGLRVRMERDHMGVVTPMREDGQGISRDTIRYAQAFQDGYLAATSVAAEAAYTRK
jgi:hypothetical protein